MANQRQPKIVQYNAPEAHSSGFIDWGMDYTIGQGFFSLKQEFLSWEDNVYDLADAGAYSFRDWFMESVHPFNPRCVFDVSHWNSDLIAPFNMKAAKAVGQLGVIIKATDGLTGVDPWYDKHYFGGLTADLLVGSYHFGRNEDGAMQADHFLSVRQPGILVLDYEFPEDTHNPMTVRQVEAFAKRVYDVTGRYPGLYADAEYLTKAAASELVVKNCWVWLAQYNTNPTMPKQWLAKGEDWTLWQYTASASRIGHTLSDEHHHKKPYTLDREQFNGTQDELIQFWKSNIT